MINCAAIKNAGKQFIGVSLVIVFGSQSVYSDTFISTIEAPRVQDTTTVFFNVGKETFDTVTTTSFTSNFSTQVGAFPLVTGLSGALALTNLSGFNLYGGANGTGKYPGTGGTINLNTAVNYFGLWVSAMNGGNTITFYREQGGAQLYQFTLAQMTGLVGTSSNTNLYYGNPNWLILGYANQFAAQGGEPFAFVNFYDTDNKFKYITIEGAGFESDNWTVGDYSAISGTSPLGDITASNTTSQIGSVVNPIFAGGT
jgi:hypothetical protein